VSRADDGVLVEGVVDLAFEEADGWTVVDFKTNDPMETGTQLHRRQLAQYMAAVRQASGRPASGTLLYL
jgi:ATP-dependent helicase/nuclease subunit A